MAIDSRDAYFLFEYDEHRKNTCGETFAVRDVRPFDQYAENEREGGAELKRSVGGRCESRRTTDRANRIDPASLLVPSDFRIPSGLNRVLPK